MFEWEGLQEVFPSECLFKPEAVETDKFSIYIQSFIILFVTWSHQEKKTKVYFSLTEQTANPNGKCWPRTESTATLH